MSDMNVGSVSGVYSAINTTISGGAEAAANSANSSASAGDVAAVYEKGAAAEEKKATYSINKMSAEERAALVEQLKQDELDRRNQLVSLVQKMFTDQAGVSKLSELFTPDKLKDVSQADIDQAKKDISEDGYFGIKQTSQRLFDFASALAGDDPEKMKEMQKAMEQGFKEAAGAWGDELPDICKDTLAAANKMFDDYYASKN